MSAIIDRITENEKKECFHILNTSAVDRAATGIHKGFCVMVNRAGIWVVNFVLMLMCLVGCGGSEQYKTIQGLQEQNKVLEEQVRALQAQVAEVKKENDSNKVTAGNDCEDRLAKIRLLNEEKVRHLESRNAELMLEMGTIQKEKITLQEFLDSGPRIQRYSDIRFGIERMIWGLIIIIFSFVLIIVANKYIILRGKLNAHVIQQASTLRQLGRI